MKKNRKMRQKEEKTLGRSLCSSENIELNYEEKERIKERLDTFYQKLEDLKQEFTPSEWYLLASSFGLEGYGVQTSEEVAEIFNCSEEHIFENRKILEKKLQSPRCQKIMEPFKK